VRNPVRLKNLRLRFLPAVLAAGLCLAWFEPRPAPAAVGIALVASGLSLRAWGAGYLVKRDDLTVTGPYAYVRHPLYAGTLLICAGFGIALGPVGWLVLAMMLSWFFVSYFPGKERRESQLLEQRYGSSYTTYRSRGGALLPTLPGFQPDQAWATGPGVAVAARGWSPARYSENNELGTALGVVVGLALLALRAAPL